ncbi:hypothetical protein FH972_019512 [Carpinus fangiana]|uniref:Uncharacterized protein n=1 Tax=Carpinus fangiana TaxID=176857 RepID=A0A5N6RRV5_9ROSI|nr:hypothetical protein FH972_019512 [Carpinus fangiana]
MGGKEKGNPTVPLVPVVPVKHTGEQGMVSKFLMPLLGDVEDSGSAEMGPQAPRTSLGLVNHSGVQRMAQKQVFWQTQEGRDAGFVNCKKGVTPACRVQAPVKRCECMKSTKIIGDGLLTALEGAGNSSEHETFNAHQELRICRETLMKLKREVELGLARLDRAFHKLEGLGPGQEEVSSSAGPSVMLMTGPVLVSSGEEGTEVSVPARSSEREGDCVGGDGSDAGAKELSRMLSLARASDVVSSGEQGSESKLPVRSSELDGVYADALGPVDSTPASLTAMVGATSGGCSVTGEGVPRLSPTGGGSDESAEAIQTEPIGVLVSSVN